MTFVQSLKGGEDGAWSGLAAAGAAFFGTLLSLIQIILLLSVYSKEKYLDKKNKIFLAGSILIVCVSVISIIYLNLYS